MMIRIMALFLIGVAMLTPTLSYAANPGVMPMAEYTQASSSLFMVLVKADRNPRTIATAAGVDLQHVYSRVVRGFTARLTTAQRAALQRHPDVVLIEQDQPIRATATQTIDSATGLWGLDRINQHTLPLSGSYAYSMAGAGVTAYLIDSGLQANHAEFESRAQNVYDALGGTGADCHGHGTHLAGIVGGVTYGVAKQVALRGVRVLDCNAEGTIANSIAGIDWVAAHATKPAVAVIAFSPVNLTSSNSAILQLAIENLMSSGVFVAVSAGNSNTDACTLAPANIPGAFTVAASTRTDSRASFSNHGTCVDAYAPGSSITSAWINDTTNTGSGTSQAAAFAAGAAALYQANYGMASQEIITMWLNATATQNAIQNNVSTTPNRLLYVEARSINSGGQHTCGFHADGLLMCWGYNAFGQATPPTGFFAQTSGGGFHTCGVRPDSALTCWGQNTYSQATPPSGTFMQVSSGWQHTCGVRTDGSLACWGYNNLGQATAPSGAFVQVSSGGFHSCGVRTNGSLACWGYNNLGQATPPSGAFVQVTAGTHHTCGVRADSSVTCWGQNTDGQATAPSGSFVQVSSGGYYTCGVRADSSITCWGRNDYGQTQPPAGLFTQVSSGAYHACGMRSDSSVACWGRSTAGQTTVPTTW